MPKKYHFLFFYRVLISGNSNICFTKITNKIMNCNFVGTKLKSFIIQINSVSKRESLLVFGCNKKNIQSLKTGCYTQGSSKIIIMLLLFGNLKYDVYNLCSRKSIDKFGQSKHTPRAPDHCYDKTCIVCEVLPNIIGRYYFVFN